MLLDILFQLWFGASLSDYRAILGRCSSITVTNDVKLYHIVFYRGNIKIYHKIFISYS